MANNQANSTVTNNLGYYSVPLLQPAAYRLTVRAQGFKESIQENIHLNVATTLSINVGLTVGQVTQSVTVTDEPPLLDTQTSSLGQVIGNESVDNLPLNGRNAYGFAALVPGVIAPYGFTQTAFDEYNDQFISINGSRPNQNMFLLDGGINSEPAFTGPGYFPSVDLVDQYKVQTSNFSAEFSHTGGGLVNVITKSGGNHLHGSAWEFSETRTWSRMISFRIAQVCRGRSSDSISSGERREAPFATTRLFSLSRTRGCDGFRADQRWARCPRPPSGQAIFRAHLMPRGT